MYVPNLKPGSKVMASQNTDVLQKGRWYTIKYNTIRGSDILLAVEGVDGMHDSELFSPVYMNFASAIDGLRAKVINTVS